MENSTNLIQDSMPQFVNQEAVDMEADKIIKKHALMGTAAGLIPLFGLDVAAVTSVQVMMIKKLSDLFGVPFEASQVRVAVSSFVATALSRMASGVVRKYFNTFSGFAATELTNAAIAGFITAATGEIYKIHFQNGGEIDSLDITDFWNYFQEEISSGKLSSNTFKEVETGFEYLMK